MKKRFSSFTIAIVALLGVLFGGLLSWMVATRAPFFRSSFIRNLSPIDQVLELISEHYVDSIDLRELQMRLLPKLVEELDPHSAYIPREESDLENQRLNGSFCGVGISFNTLIASILFFSLSDGGKISSGAVIL